ncbi:hypothetical protein ACFOY4_01330 [Actinomadura syzygii]|uniref:Uncharacterized protein n=1 Tax=Actinomadura syzygii TaxID=1427538 RepID=A0A5D0TR46_9ACTN|nr:hypothetical protein [Actinomadura syzygii]TYC08608.1 hypothetical protein FXF65_37580 [Actinomadura syzygii]
MPADPFPDPELPPPPDGAKPVADPCLACGREHALHIVERMIADPPPGTYSLAGVQTKLAVRPAVVLECRACGASAPGRVEPGGTHAIFDPADMTVEHSNDHDVSEAISQVVQGECGGGGAA